MYAKDFFSANKLFFDPGLCFVLMPFAKDFDWAWKIIKETVEGAPFNLKCERADEIDSPGYVMNDVLKKIGEARLIIVDVSGQNPNVYYELGIAHSFKNGNQVILISQSIDSVPFDLRPFRHFIYNTDPVTLKNMLVEVLSQTGIRQYDLKLSEGETKKFGTRLTGKDNCLYEIEMFVEYIGDDGVKFRMDLIRYMGGKGPEKYKTQLCDLNIRKPAMEVPNLDWSVCYKSIDAKQVRFILGRAPGFETVSS